MKKSRSAYAFLAILALGTWAACGGKGGSTPTTPTAAGTPAPTPTAQATPTPVPTTGSALPQSCRSIPNGTGGSAGCSRRTPNFLNQVRGAVDLAASSTHRDPTTGQVFDIVQGSRIVAAGAYLKVVSDALDRQGICAAYDGEEMNIRDGGGYNENYDIITADGNAWANYSVTCNPAQPIPSFSPLPMGRDADCRMPQSALTFCTKPSSVYDGDVYDAQDLVIAEDMARATPQIFNFGENFGQPYGYKIVNEPMYIAEMLKKLKAKGFCAIYDGDEFQVKRNNVFTEHFDMIKSDSFAVRIFNSTCRDAAF